MKETTIQDLKEKAILLAWILGFLLLISLLWIFTQKLQANNLMRSINNVFVNNTDEENNADNRRVSEYIQQKTKDAGLYGYWFSMVNSADRMFVFTVFKDGILIPLGAIISEEDSVTEVIPLSAHAIQVFDTLPKSILKMYTSRIESALDKGSRK